MERDENRNPPSLKHSFGGLRITALIVWEEMKSEFLYSYLATFFSFFRIKRPSGLSPPHDVFLNQLPIVLMCLYDAILV